MIINSLNSRPNPKVFGHNGLQNQNFPLVKVLDSISNFRKSSNGLLLLLLLLRTDVCLAQATLLQDIEMGWSGELWSNTNLLKWQN